MTGPRPPRIKCAWVVFFFFPQQTLKLSRGQIQCKAEITLRFRRGCGCGRTRCRAGAKLSLWTLVPSHPGSSDLGKDDTCLRPFHGFQLNSTGASLDAHTGHLPPPTPGIFRCLGTIDVVGLPWGPSMCDQERVHPSLGKSLARG